MRRLALPPILFPPNLVSRVLAPGLLILAVGGCHQGYSPNTYASNAAQQEAAVQRGVIIGVRQVMISANGTVAAATGAAAGGAAGSQVASAPVASVLGAIGGTLAGGLGGAAAAQAVGDTKGWEYIVQEDGNKLVSVTQTSKTALPLGLHVLVIAGSAQARIVPDYTVQTETASPAISNDASKDATGTEVNISPALPGDDAAATPQIAPEPAAPPAAAATPAPATAAPANPAPAASTPAPSPAPAPAAAPVTAAPPAASSATPPASAPAAP